MKAIGIKNGSGPAQNLFIDHNVPTPHPSPTQLLIKVKAFGLNRMDLSQRNGKYPTPLQAGPILGVEFSGTVEALGSITQTFSVGDEVFGLTYGGAYAEFVAVEEGTVMRKLGELSWEEAAGIPEAWMTATQALHLVGDFASGKSILWHAGASGVSIAGIQLSLAAGAKAVYVTASSQDKIDLCVDVLGATAGMNYRTQDFAKEIHRLTDGAGVDIIIDFVGQSHLQKNLDSLVKDGTIVALANMSGSLVKEIDVSAFVRKRVSIRGSSLRSRDEGYQARLCKLFVAETLPLLRNGTLKVFVERVFGWEDVAEAHVLMEGNGTRGKVVCVI